MDIPDEDNYAFLKSLLPPSFKHKIKEARQVEGDVFDVTLFADVLCKADAYKWVAELQHKTRTTFNISQSPTVTGKKVIFKQLRICQHNIPSATVNSDIKVNTRNKNCLTKLSIIIRRELNRQKGRDVRIRGMPCEIYLYWNHNHPIGSSDILRFRPVGDGVKKKLVDLFQKGHSAASARILMKMDLQHDHPHDYEDYLVDRFHCPEYRYCHYLYSCTFDKEKEPVKLNNLNFLAQRLEEVNLSNHPVKCVAWYLTNNQVIIAICTPLMRRAHRLVYQAAELVIIDSYMTAARDGRRIFLLLTHDDSESVPLGVFITNSDSTATLTKALKMLKDLIGVGAFFGREGPSVVMTDDRDSERSAVRAVWENATVLLSPFHMMQAMWRWVSNSKQRVPPSHRLHLYSLFKSVVSAKSTEECNNSYQVLIKSQTAKACPNFLSHAAQYWERREEWDLRFRGENADDFTGAAMQVLKDRVFERVKAFNLVQITDFAVTRLDAHYKHKLLDGRNSTSRYPKKWLCPNAELLSQISLVGTSIYSVPSESKAKSYNVDLDINRCECLVGANGALCQHQVGASMSVPDRPVPARSVALRNKLFELDVQKKPPPEFLRLLHDTSVLDGESSNAEPEQSDADEHDVSVKSESQFYESDSDDTEQAYQEGLSAIEEIRTQLEEYSKSSPKKMAPILKAMAEELQQQEKPAGILTTLGKYLDEITEVKREFAGC